MSQLLGKFPKDKPGMANKNLDVLSKKSWDARRFRNPASVKKSTKGKCLKVIRYLRAPIIPPVIQTLTAPVNCTLASLSVKSSLVCLRNSLTKPSTWLRAPVLYPNRNIPWTAPNIARLNFTVIFTLCLYGFLQQIAFTPLIHHHSIMIAIRDWCCLAEFQVCNFIMPVEKIWFVFTLQSFVNCISVMMLFRGIFKAQNEKVIQINCEKNDTSFTETLATDYK